MSQFEARVDLQDRSQNISMKGHILFERFGTYNGVIGDASWLLPFKQNVAHDS